MISHLYPSSVNQILCHAFDDNIEEEARVLHEFMSQKEILLIWVYKHMQGRRQHRVQFKLDAVKHIL